MENDEICWGPPPRLFLAANEALIRQNCCIGYVQFVTLLFAGPAALGVAYWNSIPVPVIPVTLAIGAYMSLPWISSIAIGLESRFLPMNRAGPRQNQYRLTRLGLHLPQKSRRDLAFVAWGTIVSAAIAPAKGLPQFRQITIRFIGRRRKIWLPADSRDQEIVAALRIHLGDKLQD